MAHPRKETNASKVGCQASAADQCGAKQNERQKEAIVLNWEGIFEILLGKEDSLTNPNRKTGMFKENKMVIDHHDDMNSQMHMKRTSEKSVPTSKTLHPCKKCF
jgi:hypothetical protein